MTHRYNDNVMIFFRSLWRSIVIQYIHNLWLINWNYFLIYQTHFAYCSHLFKFFKPKRESHLRWGRCHMYQYPTALSAPSRKCYQVLCLLISFFWIQSWPYKKRKKELSPPVTEFTCYFLIGRFFLSGFGLIKIMWGTASGSIFVPLGMLHLCGSEVQGSSAGTSVSPINCQLLRAVINPTRWEQVSPLLKIEQVITWINVQNRKVPFRREVGWIMCHSPGSRTTNIYSPSRVKLTTI